MTPEAALTELGATARATKAADMAAYHKVDRVYLGVANPEIDAVAKGWRRSLEVPERVTLAQALWETDIHEARVAAAKLLAQARMRPDAAAWALIQNWVPAFDAWAIADHVCSAGAKRLVADPARLDVVETWTGHQNFWVRRAALVMTLPWTKQNHPSADELAVRDRVLGWAAEYVPDREWFIQKAIAWWLRELSKHDAPRVRAFLAAHGADMKAFARKEAGRLLPKEI